MTDLTPEHMRCNVGFCPSVYALDDGRLLIVGKAAHDAADEGDAPVDHAYGQLVSVGAIGKDETAIIIDRALLANLDEMTPEEAKTKAWELVNEFVACTGDLSAFQLAHAKQLVPAIAKAILRAAGAEEAPQATHGPKI